jgi:thiol-disulfide isomerase/thioredoxin
MKRNQYQRPGALTTRSGFGALLLLSAAMVCAAPGIVQDVRARLAQNDFTGAAGQIQTYRKSFGITPDVLAAMSWMARAELGRKNLDQAEKWSQETYQLSAAEVKKNPLNRDPNAPLALALGASIEVEGNVMAERGERAGAVAYLQGEIKKYDGTSIHARIQKDVNLLSLEGKPAPALVGFAIPKGKPAFVLFWAHWCPDCKAEAADLKKLKDEFVPKGLVFLAPTQKYGYVAGGKDAAPEEETRYIEQVRQTFYTGLIDAPAVVNEDNFRVWGASTTPTLALVDRNGIVRMYHPGAMPYAELRARIAALL